MAGTCSCEVTFQGRSYWTTSQTLCKHQDKFFGKYPVQPGAAISFWCQWHWELPSYSCDAWHQICTRHNYTHANEQLEKLIEFYRKEKDGENMVHGPIIDGEKTRQEWSYLKELLVWQHYPTDSMTKLWELLGTQFTKRRFPTCFSLLLSLSFCLPVQLNVKEALVCKTRLKLPSETG